MDRGTGQDAHGRTCPLPCLRAADNDEGSMAAARRVKKEEGRWAAKEKKSEP